MQYVEPIISALLLIAYIFISIKQGRYITILKETNDQIKTITSVQSGLIKDFQVYRQLMNVEDFKKLVDLKLEKQELLLSKEYADKEKTIVQDYLDKVKAEEKKTTELSERTIYYEIISSELRQRLAELERENIKETERLKASQVQFHMMDQTAMHLLKMLEVQSEQRELAETNRALKDTPAQLKKDDF